jgi:large subunit ribosomal protein L24
LKIDAGGIAVERLSVADFGNATVEASGRIVTAPTPGGNIAIDLEARDLSGVIALADKFAPTLAETLRDLAGSQNNAKLALTVSLDNAGSGSATGTLAVAGRVGAFRLDVNAEATGKPSNFTVTDLRALAGTDTRIKARVESEDGNALLALIGLDRFAADEVKPARLHLSGRTAEPAIAPRRHACIGNRGGHGQGHGSHERRSSGDRRTRRRVRHDRQQQGARQADAQA